MTDPSPNQRMAAGFGDDTRAEDFNLRSRAKAYKPEHDAEADRMRSIADRLTPAQRMQLGYQDSARTAAETLDTRQEPTR